MKHLKTAATYLLCSAALSGSPSYADDTKIYSGAECQRHSGSNEYHYSSGTIVNTSVEYSLTVACPIVNDAGNIESGWIRVVDRNSYTNFKCSVKSKFRNNNGTWSNFWSGNKYSSGNTNQTQQLNFGGMGGVAGGSHYYLVCEIPAQSLQNPDSSAGSSSIVAYRVVENS